MKTDLNYFKLLGEESNELHIREERTLEKEMNILDPPQRKQIFSTVFGGCHFGECRPM